MIIIIDKRKEVLTEESSSKLGEVTKSQWDFSRINQDKWFCIDTDQGYQVLLDLSDIAVIKEEILK